MKTTLEIPDPGSRRAKSVAVERGIALRGFVTEAVENKLAVASQKEEKPWLRFAGGLKYLHKEPVRINGIIRNEFEKIKPNRGSRCGTRRPRFAKRTKRQPALHL